MHRTSKPSVRDFPDLLTHGNLFPYLYQGNGRHADMLAQRNPHLCRLGHDLNPAAPCIFIFFYMDAALKGVRHVLTSNSRDPP